MQLFGRNVVHLEREPNAKQVKGVLIGILFLLLSGLWRTEGEGYIRVEEAMQEGIVQGAVNRQEDKVLRVLAEANRYADVSVRSTGTGIGQVARRYRTGGSGLEKLSGRLLSESRVEGHTVYKMTEAQFKECAARLKSAGYYIYALRKIVI